MGLRLIRSTYTLDTSRTWVGHVQLCVKFSTKKKFILVGILLNLQHGDKLARRFNYKLWRVKLQDIYA